MWAPRLLLGLGLLCCVLVAPASAQAPAFGASIEQLFEQDLGFPLFQSYIQSLPVYVERVPASVIVEILTWSLSQQMSGRTTLLNDNAAAIAAAYQSAGISEQQQCCLADLAGEQVDPRFSGPVDLDRMCHRLALEALPGTPKVAKDINVTYQTMDRLRENLGSNPTLKWQYFGSANGVFGIYPSRATLDETGMPSCSDYDPRFRPWYTAATTVPKHVVLIVDTSGSMSVQVGVGGLTSMDLAKMAAHTVIGALGPQDMATVIAFDTGLTKLGVPGQPCFGERLAEVTPENLDRLHDFVDSLQPSGNTNFLLPFGLAYNMIKATLAHHGQDQVQDDPPVAIVFLTDGADDGDRYPSILGLVESHRVSMQNKPHIFAFSMGDVFNGQPQRKTVVDNFLRTLTTQNGGAYTDIGTKFADLRTAMGSYYAHPSFTPPASERDMVRWTVPYFDASGLGLVVTAARSVFVDDSLVGVVGIDMTLGELLELPSLGNDRSYFFVIDGQGRTFTHPLLPQPAHWEEVPSFVHIRRLERSSGFAEDVLPEMLAGNSGEQTIVVTRTIPRGGGGEGAILLPMPALYAFRPIAGTPFSLCLVTSLELVEEGLAQLDLEAMHPPDPGTIPEAVYHRFDLLPEAEQPPQVCSHFGNLASMETSAIQLATSIVFPSQAYLETPETADIVRRMTRAINLPFGETDEDEEDGGEGSSPRFGVNQLTGLHAALTGVLEPFWLENVDNSYSPEYIVWRYVATHVGLLRIYPGHPMAKAYDARERGWYKRAVAFPGLTTISPPYMDAFGAGIVITVSRAVQLEALPAVPFVFAVMAADMTMDQLYRMLDHSTAQQCTSLETAVACYVVDSSGYLILHPSFVLSGEGGSPPRVEGRWIGDLEPALAASLASQGAILKSQCNDFERRQVSSFRVIPSLAANVTVSGRIQGCSAQFRMQSIPSTNAFLIVVSGITSACRGDSACACCELCQSGGKSCFAPAGCNCPCECPLQYDACANSFVTNTLPTCPPPPVELRPEAVTPPPQTPTCVTEDVCTSLPEDSCWQRFHCQTCLWDVSGNYLPQGSRYCRARGQCPSPGLLDIIFDNTWRGTCRASPLEARDGSCQPGEQSCGATGGGSEGPSKDSDSEDSSLPAALGGGLAAGVVCLICCFGFIIPCLKGRSVQKQNQRSQGTAIPSVAMEMSDQSRRRSQPQRQQSRPQPQPQPQPRFEVIPPSVFPQTQPIPAFQQQQPPVYTGWGDAPPPYVMDAPPPSFSPEVAYVGEM